MRLFSFLALLVILAIIAFQYSDNIKGRNHTDSHSINVEDVKSQLNETVIDYQKKLEEALKESSNQEQ